MSGIVCAIRGGPASQPTITQAISLAQETDLPLYFLYVVNLDFLSYTSSSRIHTISQEMHQMGEFILLAAQSTAGTQGVHAHGMVRQGKLNEEIVSLCNELEADYVVLGRPQTKDEESIFTQEKLAQFIEHIEKQAGAKVVLTESEAG